MGGGQGLHRFLQSGFLISQGRFLILESLERQLAFTTGVQNHIPFAACRLQPLVGGLQILLQLLPGGRIIVVAAVAFGLIELLLLLHQGSELPQNHLQALLLLALVLLQSGEAFGPLPAALQQGPMVASGRIAFRHQAGLLLLQLPQFRFLLTEQLGQFGFLPSTGQQGFPQFQQTAAQGFGLVLIAAASETEAATPLGEAAPGHRTTAFQQLAIKGYGAGPPQLLTGTGQISKHKRVAEHVGEHLVVDGFKPHQLNGPTDQSRAGIAATRFVPPGKSSSTAGSSGADLVEGQKGQPTGPPAFEQLNGTGGDAIVIHNHLAETGAGGHLQSKTVAVFHFPELGHRPMDSIQPGFQQQPQGTGAATFLQRISAAFQPGDLPFQPRLLLLQPAAGALLDRQGFGGLLQSLLPIRQRLQQGLPVLLQGLELLRHGVAVGAVLSLFLAKLLLPFLFLPQPFLQLLLFLQQRGDCALQFLPPAAATLLFLHPGTGAAGHIRQPAARHLHSRLSLTTGVLGGLKRCVVRIVLEPTGLLLPFLPSTCQVMAQALQFLALLLMQAGLSLQFAAAGIEPGQARLHGQELVFPESLDLLLEGLQFSAGLVELLLSGGDGGGIPQLLSLESRLA